MSGEQKQTQCCHVYAHLCVTQDATVDPEKEADRRAEEMEFGEKEKTRPSVIGRMGAVAPCTPHICIHAYWPEACGHTVHHAPRTTHCAAPRRTAQEQNAHIAQTACIARTHTSTAS